MFKRIVCLARSRDDDDEDGWKKHDKNSMKEEGIDEIRALGDSYEAGALGEGREHFNVQSSDLDADTPPPFPDALPTVSGDTDWREFRARLVASTYLDQNNGNNAAAETGDLWAHEIPVVEPGCLLLASPIYFTHSQQYFSQSVILVVAHGPEGTMGLILNKPTTHCISDFKTNLGSEFGPCRLYLGGDVDESALNIVHDISSIPNAIEIIPGVYLGGFEGVHKAVINGVVDPKRLKIFTRYAGWGPGQLESEIRHQVWFPAAASRDVIMQSSNASKEESMWSSTLKLMGGEFQKIAIAMSEDLSSEIDKVQQAGNESQEPENNMSDQMFPQGPSNNCHGSESHRDGSGI